MEESEKWMAKATSDLATARYNLEGDMLDAALFYSQQAAEKALKTLYIKKYKKLLKIHDLVLLARKVNAPKEIIVLCSKINPAYTDARYPDLSRDYSEKDAQEIINFAEEVLKWTKKS